VSTGKHSFRGTDAARLIRATTAAGLNIKGVTLDKGTVRLDVESAPGADAGKNPWDEVLQNAQDKERAS
jgi:hypothetical protein